MSNLALTDLYQLTMAQSYLDSGKAEDIVTFEYFIRSLPQDWGYFIICGIDKLIKDITELSLTFKHYNLSDSTSREYLFKNKILNKKTLDYLNNFQFTGSINAMDEGSIVFPNEPILQVTAPLIQAQLLETFILNQLNFQIMIASKASRIVNAAKNKPVVDFGLRRAHGEEAGVLGAKACYIGGCTGTSNVEAGTKYNIPLSGTHAHSFVMAFDNELDAFRAYVKSFPNNSTLLIDTYNIFQGAKNAVIIAKEMESRGEKLNAIRIDSGDFTLNVPVVRGILDESGLNYVKIVVSNDLNEYKIARFLNDYNLPIDSFGVGTEMITSKPTAAIGGVYKMVENKNGVVMKKSEGKITYPGKKQITRFHAKYGEEFINDKIHLNNEGVVGVEEITSKLLTNKIKDGTIAYQEKTLYKIREKSLMEVKKLPDYLKTIKVETNYPINISKKLNELIR